MKKSLIASYVYGITDGAGEKYTRIMRYFIPEYITALIIYVVPSFIDSTFIASLKSTPTYAALGVSNNLMHFLFKIAESFSVIGVILVGFHNGRREFKQAGSVLRESFWVTVICSLIFGLTVYFSAYWIYAWLNVPADIIQHGVPYLRLRVVSFIFVFLCAALLGFLRGTKNTRTTMYIYLTGAVIFVALDYCLIFGMYGFPAYGLNGSAIASIVQNAAMVVMAFGFLFLDPRYKEYDLDFFSDFKKPAYIKQLFTLVWPIAIDKAILAAAYIWLSKMINTMGTCTIASFVALKDMERMAFLPAVAFAQVITFLVSNDYGAHHWQGIKSNIKKVLFLSSFFVGIILFIFSLFSRSIISLFDRCGEFSDIAVRVFPFLAILVLFDVLQLILAGALRGSGNVKIVMWVRIAVICGYFIPVSYFISQMEISSCWLKLLLIYSSFYFGNAFMSIAYVRHFRNERWKHQIDGSMVRQAHHEKNQSS